MKPLSDLKTGEHAYIVDLKCYASGLEVLNKGVFPGDAIQVLKNKPEDQELCFASGQKEICINRQKAKTVMTHFVSYTFNLN
jgi:Fe2+ transport system protein FeoA